MTRFVVFTGRSSPRTSPAVASHAWTSSATCCASASGSSRREQREQRAERLVGAGRVGPGVIRGGDDAGGRDGRDRVRDAGGRGEHGDGEIGARDAGERRGGRAASGGGGRRGGAAGGAAAGRRRGGGGGGAAAGGEAGAAAGGAGEAAAGDEAARGRAAAARSSGSSVARRASTSARRRAWVSPLAKRDTVARSQAIVPNGPGGPGSGTGRSSMGATVGAGRFGARPKRRGRTLSGMSELADVAALLADRTRARILEELLGGPALPAGALAVRVGVAPSTVSGHLAKLEAAGLIVIHARGRRREAQLARPEVAEALEALARLATGERGRSDSAR